MHEEKFKFFYFLYDTILLLYNWVIAFSCHLTAIKTL